MSVKRLKHVAQNFGQMFCGWELMFDYKTLAELGSGNLCIDVLRQECKHDDRFIEPLKIISGIHNWMVGDLEGNKLSIDDIDVAEIKVEFSTKRQIGQKLQGESWADPTKTFISCTLKCSSVVKSQGREFTSSYHDQEEWPESYSWVNS